MSTLKVDGIRSNSATSDAITLADNGTCTANITNKPNRNLVINGAMTIAQRGVSSTAVGYLIDRFYNSYSGVDENPTFAQADVASGTTPYTSGFRKSIKITNGNQTSGAGAGDYIQIQHAIEAQDIANSGWNYTSASSFITLSFWVKSSVAQNFYGYLLTLDGTIQRYAFETGALTANTWTKVTKTIAGNSNITFNNDNGEGLRFVLTPFRGTDFTDNGVSLNAWGAFSAATRTPDNTSTWYTTNDSTFELTGIQLEVGSHSTDFEFKLFGQELALCQRYYYMHALGNGKSVSTATVYAQNNLFPIIQFPVTMRTTPSLDVSNGSGHFSGYSNNGNAGFNTFSSLWNAHSTCAGLNAYSNDGVSGRTAGHSAMIITNHASAKLGFSSEL